jgi:hypothetical protein
MMTRDLHPRLIRSACALFCVLSIGWYLYAHWQLRLDAGQGDDFVDVLWFMEIFLSRTHWLAQLDALTLPNHEHITLINHLVFVLHYAVVREVNFIHYTFIGHGVVVLTALVLVRWYAKSLHGWLAAAIVVPLYCNLFYWDSMAWPITAISNQTVMLFALLAAAAFYRKPDAIWMPVLWSVSAAASQFNGLTVLFALSLASVMHAQLHGEPVNRHQLRVWLLAGTLLALVYAWINSPLNVWHLERQVAYSDPGNEQPYRNWLDAGKLPPLDHLTGMLTRAPVALCTTFGSLFFSDTQILPAAVTGLVLLLLAGWLLWHHRQHIDRFWLVAVLYSLASVGMLAFARGSIGGGAVGMTSRYRMYAFLMLLLVLRPCLATVWRHRLIGLMLLLGVITQIGGAQVLPAYQKNRQDVASSYYNWLIDGGLGRTRMIFYPHNQDRRLFNAARDGYYHAYSAVPARHKPARIESIAREACHSDQPLPLQAGVSVYSRKPAALASEITLSGLHLPLAYTALQLRFCGTAESYGITLDPRNITDSEGGRTVWPLIVLKRDIPAGHYRVLLNTGTEPDTVLGDVLIR